VPEFPELGGSEFPELTFAGIWYAFGTVGGSLASQWRGAIPSSRPSCTALSDLPQPTLWTSLVVRRCRKSKGPADYELSSGPTAAAAKSVAAKDFNNFQPARKEVLAMLITLALGETS
jgi:hypothetical protein